MSVAAVAPVVARERPILFSPTMVRAVLDRRKTKTRRLVKEQPSTTDGVYGDRYNKSDRWAWWLPDNRMVTPQTFACPYGDAGDRLWVREAWKTSVQLDAKNATQIAEACDEANYDRPWAPVLYQADGEEKNWEPIWGAPGRQRLARFMPRWLSRLTLEVTDVRLERVNAISVADARAEGFSSDPIPGSVNGKPATVCFFDPLQWFAALWDGINGDRAPWKSSPWVWVVGFKVVQP